ncbi:hypothetical protein MCAV_06750 [[Mycoplasma] cavipharyngis]
MILVVYLVFWFQNHNLNNKIIDFRNFSINNYYQVNEY